MGVEYFNRGMGRAAERRGGLLRALLGVVLACAVLGWSEVSAAGQAASVGGPAVRGLVHDAAGKPVAGAAVRMEPKDGAAALETASAADGSFAFATASAGRYALSARKEALRSADADVTVEAAGEGKLGAAGRVVELTIEDGGGTSALGSQAMEFSDAPNFTIAAVTDWTGAGGHGSDAILRTSESLTRDAVKLKGSPGSAADPVLKEALALEAAGELARARQTVGELLAKEKTADGLRLAGELDEKLGDPVTAVNELEQAVKADGSEENYFTWGSELLLHRAILQARDVFTSGTQRYPQSARMLTALGAAMFASSMYEGAAEKLCRAADLSPDSEEPYLFLGKVEMASPDPLGCAEEKLAQFVKRHGENPMASYYAAMAVWKQNGKSADAQVLGQVEGLLKRAVALDSKCSEAYLQLGNVMISRRDSAAAIVDYAKAIETNPQLAEAHYRLGLAYDRIGEKEKARREFALHEELDKQQAAEVERQRREVKQFLVKGSGAEITNP